MVKKKKTLKNSILSYTIPFILLMCVILSAVQIISTRNILYTRYESYIRNILSYVQGEIDTDDLAECMRSGVESEKYKALQKVLDNCRDRLDIHFIYVIEPLNTERFNNIRNVIAGVSKDEYENLADELVYLNMPTGDSYSPETAAKYLNAYRSGKLSFFEEVSEWGDDYTGLLPLFDSQGKAVAALCVDVDIAEIHTILHNEAITVILLTMLLGIAFVVVFIGWSVRSITDPIERLEESVVDFASKCKDQKDPAALVIDVPKLRTNNEVETLAHAISEMSEAMQDYLKGMVTAENAAIAEQKRRMAEANRDALTGVKNKHAYLDAEAQLDRQIAKHRAPEFAIAMIDVNDLKLINDTHGHRAGDQYLRDACKIICQIFKLSPVFRVGGDEFAVIVRDKDYECIEELMGKVRDHNIKAIKEGGIVIACGMSRFDNDVCVAQVFERADTLMYKNKNDLKTKKDQIMIF